jgi:hypothetical protein
MSGGMRRTPAAARELTERVGRTITAEYLRHMLRCRWLQPPAKDESGNHLWSESDLGAAERVIRGRFGRPVGKRRPALPAPAV